MRTRAALLALLCAVVAAGVQAQDTISVPKKPKTYVTDRPKVLSQATKTELEAKLKKFGDETGNQVVVWIGSTLPADATIEEYANASFNLWGIGQKEKNNGVLLMLFVKSRKMRIETGDGIRDRLPDARAAKILDEMKPQLRANDYNTAIHNATDSILESLTPPPPPPPKATPQPVAATTPASAPKSFAEVLPGCAIMAVVAAIGLVIVVFVLRAIIRGLAAGASAGGGAPRIFTGGGDGGVNRTRVDHYHHNRSSGWSWGSRRSEPTRTVQTVVHHHDDDDDDNRGGGGGSSSSSSGSSGGGFSGGGSSRGGGASDSW